MTAFDGYSTAAQLQCTAAAAFSRVFLCRPVSSQVASQYGYILIFYDYTHIKKAYTLIVINAV